MKVNVEKMLEVAIYIIIGIKVIFLISAISSVIFSHYQKDSPLSQSLVTKFGYWKERMEFIFIILMALLLIFIFTPWHNHKKYITKEMSLLFYLFGFILIITAKWSAFFEEANWYKKIQAALN
jgi:uncharacterized membrane protein